MTWHHPWGDRDVSGRISWGGTSFAGASCLARGGIAMWAWHDERQERTKYVSPDRRIGEMKDRPRPHHGLGSQDQVFDLQQVAISQDRLQRRDLCVGA